MKIWHLMTIIIVSVIAWILFLSTIDASAMMTLLLCVVGGVSGGLIGSACNDIHSMMKTLFKEGASWKEALSTKCFESNC